VQRHPDEALRVLIVSATVGAGDAGNARELARRLAHAGCEVKTADFLEAAPFGLGKALSKGYEAELKHAPWAYELAFHVWYWLPFLLVPLSRFLSLFTRRSLLRWVRESEADVIVSTFPIATQVIGDLRRRSQRRWLPRKKTGLCIPAVNFITDFGYHPFWAHRFVDLNLAVHPSTVAAVATHTGRPSIACAPLVGPRFAAAKRRRSWERSRLGLQDDEVAALISSGSWGIGTVRETLELLARTPGLVPVVACGHNENLHRDLSLLVESKGYRAVIVGWTDDMPGLMAASDVLIENAGGLTSLEAMSACLPLVSFHPIPGHGRKSASVMASAGVSNYAHSGAELVDYVKLLGRPGPTREAQLGTAAKLFSVDAARAVARVGISGPPPQPALRPVAKLARAVSAATLVGALSWFGMTTGVGVAAAAVGAGVAHPPPGQTNTVYLGVRLSGRELSDGALGSWLLTLHASAVVDASTAKSELAYVRRLVKAGIDLESGGLGFRPGAVGAPVAPWTMARCDSQSVQELSALAGRAVSALVPNRSISAWDLVDTSSAHVKMIVPNTTLPVAPSGPYPRSVLGVPQLQPGQVYVINGPRIAPAQLLPLLANLRLQLAEQHLAAAPLSGLQ